MNKRLSAMLFAAFITPVFARDLTLVEIRAKYMDHRVKILPDSIGKSDWNLVEETNGKYSVDLMHNADNIGEYGTVIAIEVNSKTTSTKNVFGEAIDPDKQRNPYFQIVVKLDSGTVIGMNTYESLLAHYGAQLIEDSEKQTKEVELRLVKLLNKSLYKTGYTQLFDPAQDLGELVISKLDFSGMSSRDIPNLTPMRVLRAQLAAERNVILVLVELPDKQTRVMFGRLANYRSTPQYPHQTEASMLDLSAELSIPTTFTKREIEAIKKHEIFSGMSEDALWWSWGFSDDSNNWGTAGKQYIFGKHKYVYVRNGKVVDWQLIGG